MLLSAWKKENEDDAHMPIGFEIVLPALVDYAKTMDLDLPYDSTALQRIYNERALKLKRIPIDVLHKIPTTLLHSLEGLQHELDWEKLLKLQSSNGSFLFSPASTAWAFMQTGNENCLRYLTKITTKFHGGVPSVYPVDIFEHLWAVDRIQRLGIARYFDSEIELNLGYVYRYWTNKGISWARDSTVCDLDDTAMAFRLLRLHGYDVSPDVFTHFKIDNQFICFPGQTTQAVTGMYNLYRASQTLLPGESILEEAKIFTGNFLREKQARNELSDKWIVAKDLAGEVEYALNFPWYSSQPRIETRYYIEQYSEDDVWIGKSLYRMPSVNNKTYLKLAKKDFNVCQSIHRKELTDILSWSKECGFEDLGLHESSIVEAYFLAVTAIFEPDMALARLGWARSAILFAAFTNFFNESCFQRDTMHFKAAFQRWDVTGIDGISKTAKRLLECLFRTINQVSLDGVLAQGRDISGHLRDAWKQWITNLASKETENNNADIIINTEAEILVLTTCFNSGELISEELILHSDWSNLMKLTNKIYSLLHRTRIYKERYNTTKNSGCDYTSLVEDSKLEHLQKLVERSMQELILCVVRQNGVPKGVKRMSLSVAKSFYYAAHCSGQDKAAHVEKVILQPLL